jgi:hypothetical protein
MDDLLQLGQCCRVLEYESAQFCAVDLAVPIKNPFAKDVHDGLVPRRPLGDCAMRQAVCIDGVGSQMLQHPAHGGLSGSDVAREPDDVLPLDFSQLAPRKRVSCASILH